MHPAFAALALTTSLLVDAHASSPQPAPPHPEHLAAAVAPSAAEPADTTATDSATDNANTTDRLSFDICLTLVSDYYFRGIVQRADTANLQTNAQAGFVLINNDAITLTAVAGSWSNFSDDTAPAAGAGPREHWYEHDTFAGATLAAGPVTLSAIYTWYNSPAADFKESEDLTITVAYDDSDHWSLDNGFAINPSLAFAVETRNGASGPDSGVWLGLGVAPGFTLTSSGAGPIDIAFPIAVGLSIDDYYQRSDGSSDTLGFLSAGAALTLGLPEALGAAAPTVTLSATLLSLHGVARELNNGGSTEIILAATTSWSF